MSADDTIRVIRKGLSEMPEGHEKPERNVYILSDAEKQALQEIRSGKPRKREFTPDEIAALRHAVLVVENSMLHEVRCEDCKPSDDTLRAMLAEAERDA
jgi:DNA-binding PadR family transcriptional regulator